MPKLARTVAKGIRSIDRFADTPPDLLPYVVPGLAASLELAEPLRRFAHRPLDSEQLETRLPPGEIEEHTACPLCGNERTRILHHRVKYRRGGEVSFEYHAGRCTNCQLLRRLPGIQVERVPDLYKDGTYSAFLDGNYLRGRRRLYERTMTTFEPFFENGAGRRLLDFGSGTGVFVELALERGFDAFGVDLAPDAVAVANERLEAERTWCGSPNEIAQLRDGGFDVITLWSVLAHFADPVEQITNLRSLLKPGGSLLIYTVNAQSLQTKSYRNGWNGFTRNHLMFWEPATLPKLLHRAGFTSVAFRDFLPAGIELNNWKYSDRDRERVLRSVAKHHNGNMMRALAVNGPVTQAPVSGAVPTTPV